ncbi:hypothetical protein JZ751_025753 [Albula glossodonta]|uniref:Uncharacterized protein n=1 Tax=Albula glossodonta TaxID=121402 RepID=A0A8T2NLQ4_9TELE|nr:hypothetical protein JZ751_025753 [Albula glossodonta]
MQYSWIKTEDDTDLQFGSGPCSATKRTNPSEKPCPPLPGHQQILPGDLISAQRLICVKDGRLSLKFQFGYFHISDSLGSEVHGSEGHWTWDEVILHSECEVAKQVSPLPHSSMGDPYMQFPRAPYASPCCYCLRGEKAEMSSSWHAQWVLLSPGFTSSPLPPAAVPFYAAWLRHDVVVFGYVPCAVGCSSSVCFPGGAVLPVM